MFLWGAQNVPLGCLYKTMIYKNQWIVFVHDNVYTLWSTSIVHYYNIQVFTLSFSHWR